VDIAARLGFSEEQAIRRSRVVSALGSEEGFLVTAAPPGAVNGTLG
jgi:hypothetical protein